MKCHLCVNYIEMQTDPATCDYLIVSGARRKEERWDMAENEQILTTGNVFLCLFGQHSTHPTFKMCSLNLVFYFLYIPHQLSPCLHPRADREGETGNRCYVQAWPWGERQRKTKEGSAFSDRHYWLPVPLEGRLPTQQQPPQKVQGRGFLLSVREISWLRINTHPIQSTKSGVSEVTSFVALELFPFICNIQTPSNLNSLIP